jgi:two-component system chemotaxis response regulator CheB
MEKIKVLIVDDSVVACRVLADAVSSDPALEVAGTALSGPLALRKLQSCLPDIIMLDIDMPEMDGIQTLGEIKKTNPGLPVIICSGLAEKGNAYAMKALLGGAADYVTKPKHVAAQDSQMEIFRKDLIGKIKAHCGGFQSSPPEAPIAVSALPSVAVQDRKAYTEGIEVVVIGVSTGGPKALAELLPALPGNLPVPVLIVQHMPPDFTKTLAANLSKHSTLKVEEGVAGAKIRPGTIWLAPGGRHMRVVRKGAEFELALADDPPVNSCRPSVDVLFHSACGVFGPRVLGVVLTGMGQDGLSGVAAIRKKGGIVFVQDEATSVVWGMPGAVANASLADRILPLRDIPNAIVGAILKSRSRKAAPAPPERNP